MTDLLEPLSLARGGAMKNRFMLAPLTNSQSHADGTLSDAEYDWLVHRATGGFGLVMSCAAHVQRQGQGFPGQLGIFSDDHLPGLSRLATGLKAGGALSSIQLHHAGVRSDPKLTGEAAMGPSEDAEFSARAMSEAEVEEMIEAFITAAVRAEKAGFDGVELHGAHGYVLCNFMSPGSNHRADRFGGSLDNRMRAVSMIIEGVRARTGPDFQLGIRISPERYGVQIGEQIEIARRLLAGDQLDYLDLSLWSCFKPPEDAAFAHKPLIDWFMDLPRGRTRVGVAGKLTTGESCRRALEHGADFVLLGRAAILHHDFPKRIATDADFQTIALPVSRAYLAGEKLSPIFIEYMNNWKGFVAQEESEPA
ncbi:MAG: NADH:flavin oxidoreductase [Caulobacteraceae bacterium]|nr:NADH:flavin oxidoreductase [Caulobacteraceae bacterium]